MGISTVLDTQVLATSGADGDVLTQQADGTYLAETPSAGGSPGGSTGQIQYNNASAFGGTVALVYAASGTHFTVTAQAATDVPVVVKGAASQTANLQEWQNSAGTVIAKIVKGGNLQCLAIQAGAPNANASESGFGHNINMGRGMYLRWKANTNATGGGNAFVVSDVDHELRLGSGSNTYMQLDASATAADTRMLLWDVDSAALVRVSVGADDSGGAGFKVLRIPN